MKKKFVTHIDYDLLGNPVRIQFTDRSYTENVYAADGRKLKTSHVTAVPSNNHLALGEMVLLSPSHILSVDSTEYLGNFLFDNGLFKQYHFDGGYFTTTGSEASYKYYVKDHLGSNRILASYNGTIQQETQYYPYGGIHHFSTDQGTQKFKYNGKELDLMHGLNLYDYGARLYDPPIGQFTSIDPLCEKYYSVSPYAYCAGNPVNRIDPDGRDEWEFNKYGYVKKVSEEKKYDAFYFVDGKGIREKSIKFKRGSIVDYRQDLNRGKTELITTINDETGDKLFKFLAQNSNVEWSNIKIGVKDGNNYITTSHSVKSELGLTDIYNRELNHGRRIPIRRIIHSHPHNTEKPSIDDHKFAKAISYNCRIYVVRKIPLSIYLPDKDKFVEYDEKTKYVK